MKVGIFLGMSNVGHKWDYALYKDELTLGDLAEPFGNNSI